MTDSCNSTKSAAAPAGRPAHLAETARHPFALHLVHADVCAATGWLVDALCRRLSDSGIPRSAALRSTHTVLTFAPFATFLAHLGAALFPALIRKDQVLPSMV